MGRFRKNKKVVEEQAVIGSVIEGLKRVYKQKMLPLEQKYQFERFFTNHLEDSDFSAKPVVVLVGQYSVGKTSFIKYLLEDDFPGQHIGPEPTTDRFLAIHHSNERGQVPGNAVVIQPDMPYAGLKNFGSGFLNKFQMSTLPAPILEHMTFIDTPGVLSGEKQRIGRAYTFEDVVHWFAERADLILMLFDANKLDISDEFKSTIERLKVFARMYSIYIGQDDKIRIILNKADTVSANQLLRVYGALMWSLGKVFKTPEVTRVYVGSFWDQPLVNDENKKVFAQEEADLMKDLMNLPRNSVMRKVNELVKRARLSIMHAYIMHHLRESMPKMGKASGQAKLMANLPDEYDKIAHVRQIPISDFPDPEKYRDRLAGSATKAHELSQRAAIVTRVDQKLIDAVNECLGTDIPALMKQFPDEASGVSAGEAAALGHPDLDEANPFNQSQIWDIDDDDKAKYDALFVSCNPVNGKVGGDSGKAMLMKSRLPLAVLGKIWQLADVDKDGQLDDEEFAVAMHLVHQKLAGYTVPGKLPPLLVPPSKRELVAQRAAAAKGSA